MPLREALVFEKKTPFIQKIKKKWKCYLCKKKICFRCGCSFNGCFDERMVTSKYDSIRRQPKIQVIGHIYRQKMPTADAEENVAQIKLAFGQAVNSSLFESEQTGISVCRMFMWSHPVYVGQFIVKYRQPFIWCLFVCSSKGARVCMWNAWPTNETKYISYLTK